VNYAERIVVPYHPRLILLYAGGNDINAGKTAEQVFGDFKAFVEKIHTALPSTRIKYISIAPNPARWAQIDRVKKANALIRAYTEKDPKLQFINVYSEMLGEDGKPLPDIYREDKLHMNANGYRIWTAIIKPYLDQSQN
jgi:lysophospholipase L1-like esterase